MTASVEERAIVRRAVVRMRARIMAVVFGMVGGLGVWVATSWLLVRGGSNVGEHLILLRNYMPGFSVTWPGAFVGLFWGALFGAVIGWLFAWVYNQVVERRAS
jgi:hypothetical protein